MSFAEKDLIRMKRSKEAGVFKIVETPEQSGGHLYIAEDEFGNDYGFTEDEIEKVKLTPRLLKKFKL